MRFLLGLAVGTALATALFIHSSEARADTVIGAGFTLAPPVGNTPNPDMGLGFDARFGYRLGLGPVFLQPEVQFTYLNFNQTLGFSSGISTDETLSAAIKTYQIMAGGRLGLAGLIQPSAYLHAGYGRVVTSIAGGSDLGGIAAGGADGGFLIDGGIAFDIKIPFVSFGVQGGFTDITVTNGSFKFIHFGPEAAVIF